MAEAGYFDAVDKRRVQSERKNEEGVSEHL